MEFAGRVRFNRRAGGVEVELPLAHRQPRRVLLTDAEWNLVVAAMSDDGANVKTLAAARRLHKEVEPTAVKR